MLVALCTQPIFGFLFVHLQKLKFFWEDIWMFIMLWHVQLQFLVLRLYQIALLVENVYGQVFAPNFASLHVISWWISIFLESCTNFKWLLRERIRLCMQPSWYVLSLKLTEMLYTYLISVSCICSGVLPPDIGLSRYCCGLPLCNLTW